MTKRSSPDVLPAAARSEPQVGPPPALAHGDGVSEEILYLAGRPTLRGFIRYVRGHAAAPPREGALVEEWQAAHARVLRLEAEEAGIADDPPVTRLPLPQYEPLLTNREYDYALRAPLSKRGLISIDGNGFS